MRCVSGPGGFSWQPNAAEQVDPVIVGQPGWAACLKSSPQAQCVMAAVALVGGINPAGPVYPPARTPYPQPCRTAHTARRSTGGQGSSAMGLRPTPAFSAPTTRAATSSAAAHSIRTHRHRPAQRLTAARQCFEPPAALHGRSFPTATPQTPRPRPVARALLTRLPIRVA